MEFEVNAEAIRNFNEKSESLLLELRPHPQSMSTAQQRPFKPEVFLSGTLTEKDFRADPTGNLMDSDQFPIAEYFVWKGKEVGLFEESFQMLQQLAENLGRIKPFRDRVGDKYLRKIFMEWAKGRYTGAAHSTELVAYLVARCKEDVTEQEVWTPIAYLSIEAEFRIGQVTFRPISEKIVDRWENSWLAGGRASADDIRRRMRGIRKEVQGKAAAVVKLIAEPAYATELALAHTEESVNLLLFFSRGALSPKWVSYYRPLGRENVETVQHYSFRPGKDIPIINKRIFGVIPEPWLLSIGEIEHIKPLGLNQMDALLDQGNNSTFRQELRDALFMYSRCAVAKEPADKLVYVLVCLESLLLRDRSEFITQNISERLAVVLGRSLEERKRIIANVKEAYDLRSRLLHHGKPLKDLKSLKEFMVSAWTFLFKIIKNWQRYPSKIDLINEIDDLKLSPKS